MSGAKNSSDASGAGLDSELGTLQAQIEKDNAQLASIQEQMQGIEGLVARKAAREFYKTPDYSIYSKSPGNGHEQVRIELGDRKADVDVDIADVILAIWALECDTIGSCQEAKSGKAYVGFIVLADAETVYSILAAAGIQAELVLFESTVKNRMSSKETIVKSANLLFDRKDIGDVARALKEHAAD